MSTRTLEFFFDCSSPWTYLAFEAVVDLTDKPGVALVFRPILVGGIFNSVNPSVYESRERPVPAKARYYAKDLRDWSRAEGVEIGSPDVFPVNSVKAMRGAFVALEQGCLVPYARAVFQAYWRDNQDISQLETLLPLAETVGLEPDAFKAAISSEAIKNALRANTEEVIERGGFGSPTMFVDGNDMYFGNDRVVLVRRALGVT